MAIKAIAIESTIQVRTDLLNTIMKRRTLLSMAAVPIAVSAGCTGNGNETGDENGENGANNGENGNGAPDNGDDECVEERLVDDLETVPAGDEVSYSLDLNEGWTLDLVIEQYEGDAQPSVQLETPDGELVLEAGPDELIYELVQIESSGEYTLRVSNEDTEDGEFDIFVAHISPSC